MKARGTFALLSVFTLSVQLVLVSVAVAESLPVVETGHLEYRPGSRIAANYATLFMGNVESFGGHATFNFDVEQGQIYTVQTELGSLTDTWLYVYDSSGALVGENDDRDPGDLASAVSFTASHTGIYIATVRGYTDYQTGRFAISLSQGLGVVLPYAIGLEGHISAGGEEWYAFYGSKWDEHVILTGLGTLPDSTVAVYASDAASPLSYNDNIPSEVTALLSGAMDVQSQYALSPLVSYVRFRGLSDEPELYYVKVTAYSSSQTGTVATAIWDPTATQDFYWGDLFKSVAWDDDDDGGGGEYEYNWAVQN